MKLRSLYLLLIILSLLMAFSVQAQSAVEAEQALEELVAQIGDPEGSAVSISLSLDGGSTTYQAAIGRVVIGEAAQASSDDQFRIASMSKTFMGVALLLLEEEGVLSLEDGLSDWLSADVYEGIANAEAVTLYDLATMSSGIPDYLDDVFYEAVAEDPSYAWTALEALDYARGDEALFAPGEGFDYSNTNYILLHLVVEAATGETLADVFRRLILDPLEMSRTYTQGAEEWPGVLVHGYEDFDGDGEADDVSQVNDGFGLGDGGLISTTADLTRFYQALFINGELLSPEALEVLLSDPVGDGYGMGIELLDDENFGTVYGHTGGVLGFSGGVFYAADLDAIAVALYASDSFSGDEIDQLFEVALTASE